MRHGTNRGSGRVILSGGRVPSMAGVLAALFVFHVVSPAQARAYIDPVTGSIVLQVLAAGALAALASFRKLRRWVAGLFRRGTVDPDS